MKNIKTANKIALFFTYNISLKTWNDIGSLFREINIYKRIAGENGLVYFITYGNSDVIFQNKIPSNIIILDNKFNLPAWLYSIFIPIYYLNILKKVQVLKTNQVWGSWSAILAKILLQKKLIIRQGYQLTYNAKKSNIILPIKLLYHLIEWISYKVANLIFVTTNEQLIYINKYYKINTSKIKIISNSIDTDIFKPYEEKLPNNNKKNIFYIGRLDNVKNIINLLNACINLSNIKLFLIGNGPLRNPAAKLIEDKNIDAIIMNNIPNDKIPEVLHECDIFVLPSLYENNPKILLEAMACGLPVIATNIPGINNIVTHGKNGYLCGTSSEEIRKAIQILISNHQLRKYLGDSARQFILENYDMNNIINDEIEYTNFIL